MCTESYIVIGCFEHKSEAKALYAYLRTSFARYLLLQAISSLHITRERFVFVPLQDFSNKSDIDWTQPIEAIDQCLFDKYGLTEDERAEILKTISPM